MIQYIRRQKVIVIQKVKRYVKTDVDEISQNTFAVTTDEDTAFPHHVTARSVIPTSDVDAYQAQHTDTSIGKDPTP